MIITLLLRTGLMHLSYSCALERNRNYSNRRSLVTVSLFFIQLLLETKNTRFYGKNTSEGSWMQISSSNRSGLLPRPKRGTHFEAGYQTTRIPAKNWNTFFCSPRASRKLLGPFASKLSTRNFSSPSGGKPPPNLLNSSIKENK